MSPRKTSSGRLVLDTGEWEAFKEEVVDEVVDAVKQDAHAAKQDSTQVEPLRSVDSSDYIRAIAGELYTKKQRECLTSGPVGQLTRELRDLKQEVMTVTTQVESVKNELGTANAVKEVQERLFTKRLTLVVGGFTTLGVLANVINILWAMIHRGH